MDESRLQTILYGAAYFEYAMAAALFFNKSFTDYHPYADDEARRSRSMRRIWFVFTIILGASRWLAAEEPRSRAVAKFVFLVHFLELCFFYREAMDQFKRGQLKMEKTPLLLAVIPIPVFLYRLRLLS